MKYFSLGLAGAVAALSVINRPEVSRQHDAHVQEFWRRKRATEREARQQALVAEKRLRDAPMISRAEEKRARKAAKRARHMAKKPAP